MCWHDLACMHLPAFLSGQVPGSLTVYDKGNGTLVPITSGLGLETVTLMNGTQAVINRAIFSGKQQAVILA